jgi:hypothetical protein
MVEGGHFQELKDIVDALPKWKKSKKKKEKQEEEGKGDGEQEEAEMMEDGEGIASLC